MLISLIKRLLDQNLFNQHGALLLQNQELELQEHSQLLKQRGDAADIRTHQLPLPEDIALVLRQGPVGPVDQGDAGGAGGMEDQEEQRPSTPTTLHCPPTPQPTGGNGSNTRGGLVSRDSQSSN
jgi:hypothetical protein